MKFKLGQKIRHINDPKSDAGEIIAFSFQKDRGYLYTISLKDWEPEKRETIDAVKHMLEEEAVLVKEEKE